MSIEDKELEVMTGKIGQSKVIGLVVETLNMGLEQFLKRPSTTSEEAAVVTHLIEMLIKDIKE